MSGNKPEEDAAASQLDNPKIFRWRRQPLHIEQLITEALDIAAFLQEYRYDLKQYGSILYSGSPNDPRLESEYPQPLVFEGGGISSWACLFASLYPTEDLNLDNQILFSDLIEKSARNALIAQRIAFLNRLPRLKSVRELMDVFDTSCRAMPPRYVSDVVYVENALNLIWGDRFVAPMICSGLGFSLHVAGACGTYLVNPEPGPQTTEIRGRVLMELLAILDQYLEDSKDYWTPERRAMKPLYFLPRAGNFGMGQSNGRTGEDPFSPTNSTGPQATAEIAEPPEIDLESLPERLRRIVDCLKGGRRMRANTIGAIINADPSRILNDRSFKRSPWKEWIDKHIGRERGFYWLKQGKSGEKT